MVQLRKQLKLFQKVRITIISIVEHVISWFLMIDSVNITRSLIENMGELTNLSITVKFRGMIDISLHIIRELDYDYDMNLKNPTVIFMKIR